MNLEQFYPIDNFPDYAISRDGQVYSKLTQCVLDGSVNPDGYKNYRLKRADGHTLTIGLHRLIAIVFVPFEGDITNMVVNHKDGDKSNNDPDNLEWTTHTGNIEHAGKMGLTEKCKAVSVRDTKTGEVLHFDSFMKCAKHYRMSKDAIAYRARVGEKRVFPECRQYRLFEGDLPWFDPSDVEAEMYRNSTSKCVDLKCLITERIARFDRLGDLAAHLQVSPSTITKWINLPNQPTLPGLIQIKWAHDSSPWRVVKDPMAEISGTTGKRPVLVIEPDGREVLFDSAKECAASKNLSPTALNYRLSHKGKNVFSDGCRYLYYSDFITYRNLGPSIEQSIAGILLN